MEVYKPVYRSTPTKLFKNVQSKLNEPTTSSILKLKSKVGVVENSPNIKEHLLWSNREKKERQGEYTVHKGRGAHTYSTYTPTTTVSGTTKISKTSPKLLEFNTAMKARKESKFMNRKKEVDSREAGWTHTYMRQFVPTTAMKMVRTL